MDPDEVVGNVGTPRPHLGRLSIKGMISGNFADVKVSFDHIYKKSSLTPLKEQRICYRFLPFCFMPFRRSSNLTFVI